MFAFLKRQLDYWAIRDAAKAVACSPVREGSQREATRLLESPDFLSMNSIRPAKPLFAGHSDFTFRSLRPVSTSIQNNLVHGKFFPASKPRGTVLLIHGWNAEYHYFKGLPRIAARLNDANFSAILVELPFHAHRRPQDSSLPANFINSDLPLMLQLVDQSLADLQSLLLWAQETTGQPCALWGYSLGAWLAGLLCTVSTAPYAAILTTPVTRLDLAIESLSFCEPIRHALKKEPLDFSPLNLAFRSLQIPRERVRIEEGIYDGFVPGQTIEELRQAWRLNAGVLCPHGHISILMSRRIPRQTISWLGSILP